MTKQIENLVEHKTIEQLLQKKTILTAAEARQITNVKSEKEKRLNALLEQCRALIVAAVDTGADSTKITRVPGFIVEDLQESLEKLGYEVGIHGDGDNVEENIFYLWITW